MVDHGVVFLTRFVCAPEKLAEAESLYRRRVSGIDPRLAVVEASDDHALPIDDDALLWELRDTALYEGIADVEKLGLHQISSRLRLLAGEDDRITDQLFFSDPAAADPFPAEVTRLPAPKPAPPAAGVALLDEGVWSVTVHALVPQAAKAEDVFHDLRAGLDVVAASEITEVGPEDSDYGRVFGPLVVAETRALLAGEGVGQDYPAGRLRLTQRWVVRHSGLIRTLGGDGRPAAFTAERLTVF